MNLVIDELKVFSGTAHPELTKSVCQYLEIPVGQSEAFKFANDNTFVRILENIRQRDVFLIQPTCAPTNDNLMELLIMIDACKRASAGRKYYLLNHALPFPFMGTAPVYDISTWHKVSLPLLYSAMANSFMVRIDVLALEIMHTSEHEVGVFILLDFQLISVKIATITNTNHATAEA